MSAVRMAWAMYGDRTGFAAFGGGLESGCLEGRGGSSKLLDGRSLRGLVGGRV